MGRAEGGEEGREKGTGLLGWGWHFGRGGLCDVDVDGRLPYDLQVFINRWVAAVIFFDLSSSPRLLLVLRDIRWKIVDHVFHAWREIVGQYNVCRRLL